MQKLSRSKKLYLYVGVISLLFLGTFIAQRIAITTSPSLINRVFFLDNRPELKIEKGDYVLFTKSYSLINEGKPLRVIKKIACLEGDMFRNLGKKYYCNGEYLGMAKEESIQGEKLNNFLYDGEVPEVKLVVWGYSKDSLDTRYFGFLEREKVEAIAHPIW